jgi:Folliculin-interacting protein N-terminus
MLGRLFGNAASSSSSANYPRDSVVDEGYTRSLLYPDHAFPRDVPPYVPQIGAGRVGDFDDWSGLELDASRDFRILIGQDALGDSEEPCVLFDTHPIPQPESPIDPAPRIGSLQNPTHRRGGSTTSALKSPTSPLYFKPQQRASVSGPNMLFATRNRSSTFSGASDEHDPRHIRSSDSKEETRTILNCAFGSSAGAASGTKMHILSLGSGAKELPITPSSPGAVGNVSPGYFRKRDPIARAHTSGLSGVRPSLHERSHSSSGHRPKFTDAVLITKLFSVNLPEPTDVQPSNSSEVSLDGGETPSPVEHPVNNFSNKRKKPRAKKTPVFAIILVVQLPTSPSTFSRPSSRAGMHTPPIYSSVRSFHSSFNSHLSSPKLMSFVTPIDRGDPRVNALVEHWDIVDRTLTLLEHVSCPKILDHLKQVDSFSSALVSKPSKPKEKTMQRTNQINLYLSPLALSSDPSLKETTMQAVQRIRRALRIPRVALGQGRWGLWNDELIRIARSYDGKEQKIFIVNLLTAFLGAHTAEWMALLAPSWYRRRRSVRQRTIDPDAINTRTVIVSNDRSIARRLIFLLSSFLAGDDRIEHGGDFYRGPGSSISLRNAILDSPSLEVPTNTRQSRSPERHQSHNSDPPQEGLFISRGLHRKPSDIHSIRSIPIPASDLSVRKSSAATTSTVTPNPTTPVPHFSSGSGPDPCYFPDDSTATASLNKIWRNANRDSESSTVSTKWGSFLSGFWSKESSASASESTAPSASSSVRVRTGSRLDAMVNDLGDEESSVTPGQAIESTQLTDSSASKALPVKLQVNADEGVIDVDIGIPGFLSSSNDSGLASPLIHNIRHVSSVASFDSLAPPKRHLSPRASSLQSRVAGFLPRFHPDYSLQAVRAGKPELPDLIEDIKGAMLSEPFPEELTTSGWVDVSTTIIANAQTASVNRLRLKRKVTRLSDHKEDSDRPVTPLAELATAPRPIKRSSTAYSEFVHEEAFSYESVADPDPLLADAIERILSRDSNHASRSISPAPLAHSRQTSTGTQGNHRGSNKHTLGDSRSPDGFSRGLSGNVIVGALEDMVKSINHDLTEERKGQNADTEGNERSSAKLGQSEDNALREGVRSWLFNVEQTAVW